MKIVVETDIEITLKLKDDSLSLRLPEAPSTGYLWSVLSIANASLDHSHHEGVDDDTIGSPGVRHMDFTLQPGASISLGQSRPWASDGPKQEITISSQPQ